MRYKGKQLKGPKTETLVIPREPTYEPGPNGQAAGTRIDNDVVFIAQAVLDFTAFDLLCPPPLPPNILKPGGVESKNLDDPDYKKAINEWGVKKRDWLILKSLELTPDIEWETVKMDDPETYVNYKQELVDAGFNTQEITMIVGLALKVNSVDEDKMEEARQRFLARQAANSKS